MDGTRIQTPNRLSMTDLRAMPCERLEGMGLRHINDALGRQNLELFPRPPGCVCPIRGDDRWPHRPPAVAGPQI